MDLHTPALVPDRSGLCLPRGPQTAVTSASTSSPITCRPAAHSEREETLAHLLDDLDHRHSTARARRAGRLCRLGLVQHAEAPPCHERGTYEPRADHAEILVLALRRERAVGGHGSVSCTLPSPLFCPRQYPIGSVHPVRRLTAGAAGQWTTARWPSTSRSSPALRRPGESRHGRPGVPMCGRP